MINNPQNKKNNFFKLHKQQALKDIEISIKTWSSFQKKNFFYQILSKQKKTKHWEASNLMLNLFHIHLTWSKSIIRSQTNIEKKDVLSVLNSIKHFYSKISIVKPDLMHPDIFECFNLTAKENNLKQKKIKFKDKIEINFYDPFDNILGKEMKNIEHKYYCEKKIALKSIQNTFDFLDQIDNKLYKFDEKNLEKPEILIYSKTSSLYELKFLWCGQELESYQNLTKIDLKKKLNEIKKIINYFNISRPNHTNDLIHRMYKCLMNHDNTNYIWVLGIKRKINMIKKKFKNIINI